MLRVAVGALRKHKMRAGLTVLGIVIGIAAVTAMVSIGQSASDLVQGQLQSLGTNAIFAFPSSRRTQGVQQGHGAVPSMTGADCDAIIRDCHNVLSASPVVHTTVQLIYGNSNWNPREVVGVGPGYLTVGNWQLRRGAFFSDRDITAAAKTCVLGQTIVEKLFQTADPLGKTIRINRIPFQIIGVLAAKGANVLLGGDQDNIVVVPYTTVRKRLQGSSFTHVDYIIVSARSAAQIADAEDEVKQLLCERHRIHPGDPPDFGVENMTEAADMLGTITTVMTLLLASIAGISLVVGGVGVMNIMLVSVTERTREIGIRLAVGARARDILRQFLVEAVLLSSIGGVIGVLLGVAASLLITNILSSLTGNIHWPAVVSLRAALVAMLFAGGIGVLFGYYPARRASRLDPIEALRYE
jgi:putative ABC transport system permease protein